MRCLVKTIEHDSRADVFTIVPLGDVHLGAAACDEKLFQQTVDHIRDTPETFWIGMGDMVEAIPRQDKRYNEDVVAKWLHGKSAIIKYQRDRLIETLKPIGHKCLAYVLGNHELCISEQHSSDVYLDVIEAIRPTPETDLRMDMAGWLLLKFQRCDKGGTRTIKIYTHHGFGGGDLMGGSALKLERLSESFDADIYCMGHTHKRLVFPTVMTSVTRTGGIIAQNRYHINTGSFLKTALPIGTTYSERFGKKPLSLGAVEIEIRPGAEDDGIRVTI